MKTSNKILLIILIFISISLVSYEVYYTNEQKVTQNIQVKTNSLDHKKEKTKPKSLDVISFKDEYTDEALQIDNQYNEFIKNTFPISPFLDELHKEFANKDDVEDYLNEVFEDLQNRTMEAVEIASLCFAKNRILNRLKGKNDPDSLSINQYYSVMFDKCDSILGENDIFFTVEKMAQEGNINEQLNYLSNLNSAIVRKVIDPKASPLDYLQRRDQGFNWLHMLASKGVTTAYSLLARHYYFGINIEKDYALSYFYAAMANRYDLNSHYDEIYLSNARSNLSEEEYNRVNRMSNGEFP